MRTTIRVEIEDADEFTAGDMRGEVAVSLPFGYKRDQTWTLSRDMRTLTGEIVDKPIVRDQKRK